MGYIITAKQLGTPDPDAVTNYYTSAQGLINVDYDQMTLVWSWKGINAYKQAAWRIFEALGSANDGFKMAYAALGGGWTISLNARQHIDNDQEPGPFLLGEWGSGMFARNSDGSAVLWVDGVETQTWSFAPLTHLAMTNMTMGRQALEASRSPWCPEGCISHVWCHNTYLDPATNWSKFFDTNNRPISLGENGEIPTGSQPLSFFPDGDPTNNRGSLDNWTEVGTVPTCATSPTDGNTPDPPDPPIPGYPKDCDFKLYHALDTQLRQQIVAHLNTLCGRINEVVIDGLGEHENAYNPHGKNFWKGDWVQKTYQEFDQVTDGPWLMIANKITDDRAAPQPVGTPDWLLPTNPAWTPQFYTGVVYSGIELLIPADRTFAITQIRAWLPDVTASAHYRVIVYDITTGQIQPGQPFLGTVLVSPGWYPIFIDGAFLRAGETVGVVLESYNSSATTDFNFPQVYTGTSQNAVDPGTGNWNRDNQQTVIRLNETDADGGDVTALLASVTPGTIIKAQVEGDPTAFWEYSVLDVADLIGFYGYTVSLINSGGAGPLVTDRCTMFFQVPVAASTEYVSIAGQYAGDPIISGLLSFDDIGAFGITDDAYGIDIQYREYVTSDDWDIQAFSSALSSGDTGSSVSSLSATNLQISGTWFERWLPAELDRLAEGNEGSIWIPGPPPTAAQILRINQFVAYTSRRIIDLGDSHLWQELVWLESVGILDPGRAAVLILPP